MVLCTLDHAYGLNTQDDEYVMLPSTPYEETSDTLQTPMTISHAPHAPHALNALNAVNVPGHAPSRIAPGTQQSVATTDGQRKVDGQRKMTCESIALHMLICPRCRQRQRSAQNRQYILMITIVLGILILFRRNA